MPALFPFSTDPLDPDDEISRARRRLFEESATAPFAPAPFAAGTRGFADALPAPSPAAPTAPRALDTTPRLADMANAYFGLFQEETAPPAPTPEPAAPARDTRPPLIGGSLFGAATPPRAPERQVERGPKPAFDNLPGLLAPAVSAPARTAPPRPSAAPPSPARDPLANNNLRMGIRLLQYENAVTDSAKLLAAEPGLARGVARQAMDAIAAFLSPKLPEWLRPSLDASCRDCAEAAERAVARRHDLAVATDVVRTLDDAARHARAERARAAADGDIATVERLDLHLGDIAGVRARYAAARDRLAAETERDRAVDRPAEAGVAANSEAATTTGVPVPPAPAAAPPSPEHGDGGDDPDQGGGNESVETDPAAEENDETESRVTPEERRFPDEAPTRSNELSAIDTGANDPAGIDRARELRRHFAEIGRVAMKRPDGTYVLSDADVSEYIEAAKQHIRPEHLGVFVLTVAAVRAGALAWPEAAEALIGHYAPQSLGAVMVDAALDTIPVVGEIKSAVELVAALHSLAQAVESGDKAGIDKYAQDAIFLLATLVPVAGRGIKVSGKIPGLAKLLGDINAAKSPAEQRAIWEAFRKATGLEGHHLVMQALGGRDLGVIYMLTPQHQRFHRIFEEYMLKKHKHLFPVAGNSGIEILNKHDMSKILRAHASFYRKHLKGEFSEVAREFFRLHGRRW